MHFVQCPMANHYFKNLIWCLVILLKFLNYLKKTCIKIEDKYTFMYKVSEVEIVTGNVQREITWMEKSITIMIVFHGWLLMSNMLYI